MKVCLHLCHHHACCVGANVPQMLRHCSAQTRCRDYNVLLVCMLYDGSSSHNCRGADCSSPSDYSPYTACLCTPAGVVY